jgi:hypothetical protein
MQSIPALPADPGLRLMVLFACLGITSLAAGTLHGAIRRDRDQLQALGGPLLLLIITLGLGQQAQGFHIFIMATITILIGWATQHQKGFGRSAAIGAAIGIGGSVCCALLLF